MRIPLLLAVAVCLLGCHKKEAPAADQAPPSITAHAENKVAQGVAGTVNERLTVALRGFVQKNGRMPQSFHEFSSTTFDSTPRPPEGMKWVIDASDTTVKAVPK